MDEKITKKTNALLQGTGLQLVGAAIMFEGKLYLGVQDGGDITGKYFEIPGGLKGLKVIDPEVEAEIKKVMTIS